MSTETATDLELILQAVAQGRKVDPEIARRVHERSEHVRNDVFQKQGLVNVSELTARE